MKAAKPPDIRHWLVERFAGLGKGFSFELNQELNSVTTLIAAAAPPGALTVLFCRPDAEPIITAAARTGSGILAAPSGGHPLQVDMLFSQIQNVHRISFFRMPGPLKPSRTIYFHWSMALTLCYSLYFFFSGP
jgi:hypothetical protein